MENRLPEKFKTIKIRTQFPTLPQIPLRLIELCSNETNQIEGISQIIHADAPLSAKVMNMANSCDDDKSKSVTTIDQDNLYSLIQIIVEETGNLKGEP